MAHAPETSKSYEIAGRAGLAARAVVYALIAGLMLRAIFLPGGNGGAQGGEEGVRPSEAFQWLETEVYGQALLLAIGLGLALYAVWRFVEAGADTGDEGEDAEGLLARLGMVASGAGYALVGVSAILVLFGGAQGSGSGGGATKTAVQWLLEQPFGPALAIVLGLVLAGIGCAQIWRACKGEWKDDLDLSGWAGRTTGVIAAAIALRGVLVFVVGVFVILAGWQADPSDAKGLSGAITWLRQQPYGLYFYILGALTLAGYGLYSFVQSRRMEFGPSPNA